MLTRFTIPECTGTSSGISKLLLADEFTDSLNAPLDSTISAIPGHGLLNKFSDSGNNASIINEQFKIASVVGDLNPAYYYTQDNGVGYTRVNDLALVSYAQGSSFIGWSISSTLTTANLVYGTKERSAYVASVEKTDALAIGDPVNIIILRSTGALHVCRVGLQDYLCYIYRNNNTSTLYPTILGSVCNYDAIYAFNVQSPTPTIELTGTINQGDVLTHPLSSFTLEFTVTTCSSTADTRIAIGFQDVSNYLMLVVTPVGALNLVRRVAGVNTTDKAIFGSGVVTNGSHIVVQFNVPSQLVSSGGNRFKVWCGSSFYDSTISATAQTMIDTFSVGSVIVKPSDCTLNNLGIWPITL